MRYIAALIINLLIAVMSCTSYEISMREMSLSKRPAAILIGSFERRNLKFDPFMVQNFRDTISFEMFKRGYNTELFKGDDEDIKKQQVSLGSGIIQTLCQKHGSDLFIQGAVSEHDLGDFLDSTTSTLVTFAIYDNKGRKIGEAHLSCSDTLSNIKTMQKIAERFVESLHEKFQSLP